MMLRIQLERQGKTLLPTMREYCRYFGLSADAVKMAKPGVLVMHPGPMNRGVEICFRCGGRSAIRDPRAGGKRRGCQDVHAVPRERRRPDGVEAGSRFVSFPTRTCKDGASNLAPCTLNLNNVDEVTYESFIKGGRVIDPSQDLDEKLDIQVVDGKIAETGKKLAPRKGVEVIDAKGLIVAPGLIDMHVHLRDPGLEYKEDIVSGTRSAAAGGFTSIACCPTPDR